YLWRNGEKQMLANDPPVPGHHRPKTEEIDFDRYYGKDYAPDLMLEEALGFIRKERKKPFFLYFAPIEPHVAMQPPREWVDRYPKSWDQKPYRGQRGYLPHPRPRAGYAAMISDLDEHVGAIVTEIDKLGLGPNTLILFSSDNGPTHDVGGVDTEFFDSTGGLRGRKGSVYEGGIRVPMIARWTSRIAAGTRSDHVSAFYDVLPTLAELSGAPVPDGVDGISFLPTLLGKGEQPRHDHLVWEFHGYQGQQALIFGDWKAVRRGLRKDKLAIQLYNLPRDPAETRDVAGEHPDLVARAAEVLAAEHTPSKVFMLPVLDGKPRRR
ncbi:MAG: sulfatase-like hydrolase/transferase, partial [Planctomycetota bacterium]